jgi:hypothetical protein
MKHWATLALIIGGLLFVISMQLAQAVRREQPASAVASEPRRVGPPEKPAPERKAAPLAQAFGGYPCLVDCSEDKAGYRWAEQRGISDPDDCTGITAAFMEGCRVYAEHRPTGDGER